MMESGKPIIILLWIVICLFLTPFSAAISKNDGKGLSYAHEQLADKDKEAQAFALMQQLRCIQCQGQSIADSDAPIAEAMRHQVRVRIKDNQSSDDIKVWMIDRYGDYVSFEPPTNGLALLLWSIPVIIFIIAIFLVLPLFRLHKRDKEKAS